jgi:hypothetical protein
MDDVKVSAYLTRPPYFWFPEQLERSVVHPKVVDHENFEARRAVVPTGLLHLGVLRPRIHHRQVKRVIDAGRSSDLFWRSMARPDSPPPQVEVIRLVCPAAGRRNGAGFKIILGIGPYEGHGQMGCGVDHPGQDVFSLCNRRPLPPPGQADSDGLVVPLSA